MYKLYNIDSLQNYYAFKYYKVYKHLPKPSIDDDKNLLIAKIDLLERLSVLAIYKESLQGS